MRNSFVELSGRERAKEVLDKGTFREIIEPYSKTFSPHLMKQGIVPQCDDGIVISRGKIDDKDILVISIEGNFQGGGIGEISGARFCGALELVLMENKNGNNMDTIIIYDTGGVRLQEANYGLLAISEICSVMTELRMFANIIGIIPGRIGCFGGMSITAGMCNKLIMTREGRLTLNGPEVIEQEAGKEEFDSSDKRMIWDTLGGLNRVKTGFADYLVEDDIHNINECIRNCLKHKSSDFRNVKIEEYTKTIGKINSKLKFTPSMLRNGEIQIGDCEKEEKHEQINSRGRTWFNAITCNAKSKSDIDSILYANKKINSRDIAVISVVPDSNNRFSRARKGEVGIEEGWEISRCIREIVNEDKGKIQRPIISVVDSPSQAYGYIEELLGLFLSCSASASAYAYARLNGHPVVTLIVGKAISGAFLSHGLQGSYMIALDDKSVMVNAMGKNAASRITRRSITEMEEAAKEIPGIAYDIKSFYKLGSIEKLIKLENHDNPSKADISTIWSEIEVGIEESLKRKNTLGYRFENDNAKKYRKLSIEIRQELKKSWK